MIIRPTPKFNDVQRRMCLPHCGIDFTVTVYRQGRWHYMDIHGDSGVVWVFCSSINTQNTVVLSTVKGTFGYCYVSVQ